MCKSQDNENGTHYTDGSNRVDGNERKILTFGNDLYGRNVIQLLEVGEMIQQDHHHHAVHQNRMEWWSRVHNSNIIIIIIHRTCGCHVIIVFIISSMNCLGCCNGGYRIDHWRGSGFRGRRR